MPLKFVTLVANPSAGSNGPRIPIWILIVIIVAVLIFLLVRLLNRR